MDEGSNAFKINYRGCPNNESVQMFVQLFD